MQWPSLYQLAWEIGSRRGQLKAARKVLRILGDRELGPPDARIANVIERLDDLEQLERMVERIRTARNWQGLLGPLLPGHRKETGAMGLTQCPKVRLGRRRAILALPTTNRKGRQAPVECHSFKQLVADGAAGSAHPQKGPGCPGPRSR